jgi:hypothetical protein
VPPLLLPMPLSAPLRTTSPLRFKEEEDELVRRLIRGTAGGAEEAGTELLRL